MSIEIREATDDDLDDLARLRWQWRIDRNPAFDGTLAEFRLGFADWWSAQNGRCRAVVGTDDGRVIGMGFLALVNRVPDPGVLLRHHGDLQSLYVVPEHRRSGLGSRIVQALVELARANDCDRVNVHSGRRSVALYERSGFEHFHQLMNLDLGG